MKTTWKSIFLFENIYKYSNFNLINIYKQSKHPFLWLGSRHGIPEIRGCIRLPLRLLSKRRFYFQKRPIHVNSFVDVLLVGERKENNGERICNQPVEFSRIPLSSGVFHASIKHLNLVYIYCTCAVKLFL